MNLVLAGNIRIPVEFHNLEAFREWSKSGQYPERGDYFYLDGDLWVDLSMETLLHNQIKNQIATILTMLITTARSGLYCGDRMRLVHDEAKFSCEPDGMYVSHAARKAGRIELEEGPDSLEVIGSPDMVLEVASSSSVHKDTVTMRKLYWQAGIREYWLVNPLGGELKFEIMRHTEEGYVSAPKIAGWIRSAVFRRSFRLTPARFGKELPQFKLQVKK